MIGDFSALYLNRTEFKNVAETRKRFAPPYRAYLIIHILHHFNENNFEAYVSNADDNSKPVFITYANKNKVIIQEYEDKVAGVFTFDGIRFFTITNIATVRDAEKKLVFTFQFINFPTFSQKDTAFMVMPFGNSELNNFYQNNIKEYLKNSKLALEVYRADDFKGTDVIADTILEQIQKAEFIICDITNSNKNVFFELGYARGINKDIVFILEQNMPSEFFDVNHIRRIEYSYEKCAEFSLLLVETLISMRRNRQ